MVPVVITLWLLSRLDGDRREPGHIDVVGAVLCALGFGGPVFALIEQPTYGWGDARVAGPLIGGVVLFAALPALGAALARADDAAAAVPGPGTSPSAT